MNVSAQRTSASLTNMQKQSITRKQSTDKPQGDVNMNEMITDNEDINLTVVFPDQRVKEMMVKYDTPMMDLLVQVTSSNRLKPGEHAISVISDETGRTVEYKSSQTIGSLGVSRVYLLNKAMQKKQRENEIQKQKDASKFEPTIRVTINMPRGVKSLQRLNPNQPIMDIFKKICLEKGFDASRYEVRITKQLQTVVDMSKTLNDYRASEITIVQCSDESSATQVPDYHSSMVDISRVGTASYTSASHGETKMADPFEKVKKKKGLFSFLRKDKSKSAADDGGSEAVDLPKPGKKFDERHSGIQALPQNGDVIMSHNKPQAKVNPQPKVQPAIREEVDDVARDKALRAPSKKKYKAPPPPSARPKSTMNPIIEDNKTPMYASTPNLLTSSSVANEKPRRTHAAEPRNHSRNSSDSSGYHEPPVTPPDSASSPSTANGSSLTRPAKKPAQPKSKLPNQRPVSAVVHGSQTQPGAAPKKAVKKKAAPIPPQLAAIKKAPSPPSSPITEKAVESEDETTSLSSHNDDTPERGLVSFSAKSAPPPIFIPPPPPESPPPPSSGESPQHETPGLGGSDSPGSVDRAANKTPSLYQVPIHDRSESRCSRTSVNTIDDVQQYFDLAIAAGESQLRSEQGSMSPVSTNGANEEVSKLTQEMTSLTANLEKEPIVATPGKSPQSQKSSEDEIDSAVAMLDRNIGEDEGSDGSLVPDGENFVVASSKLPSGGKTSMNGSVRSTASASDYVKPVEEISYGDVIRFENPFRSEAPPVRLDTEERADGMTRRDSQISDSTLPDSEHTDRPQSSSLQSSGLQSDEDESVTETGDGYDTTGTEKVSQSETETSTDVTDSPITAQSKPKRGLFVEAKGRDVDRIIYGDKEMGSVRGVPGQDSEDSEVKCRTASFTHKSLESASVAPERKPEQVRPKSVFAILSSQKVTSDAPKRRSAVTSIAASESSKAPPVKTDNKPITAQDPASMSLYSRPLPVYSRMNSNKSTDPSSNPTPTSPSPRPLASLLADSMRSGEATKSMKKLPEPAGKPMFFKAARNSRTEIPTNPDRIENVVKLDTAKYEVKSGPVAPKTVNNSLPNSQTTNSKRASAPPTAAKPSKPGANLTRKESLKEQFNKLQENMAKWQNKLKDNENKVKELTASQQNLSTVGLQLETKPAGGGLVKSTSTSESLSKTPFSASNEDRYKSVPSELHKKRDNDNPDVTLRSAASRVIQKAEPELDPMEKLMHSIRNREGRTSEDAPDRGIYVSTGDKASVSQKVAEREIAPSTVAGANGIPPPPPAPVAENKATATRDIRRSNPDKLVNGTSKTNDPRFNPPASARDNLLAQIAGARGKPSNRRKIPIDSSSSQSSSDELREIEVRHKPQKAHRHKNNKRSISDPFPPQGPNSRNRVQPTPTELDPREELMIAIRTSGGQGILRQVNEDEIKWSDMA